MIFNKNLIQNFLFQAIVNVWFITHIKSCCCIFRIPSRKLKQNSLFKEFIICGLSLSCSNSFSLCRTLFYKKKLIMRAVLNPLCLDLKKNL